MGRTLELCPREAACRFGVESSRTSLLLPQPCDDMGSRSHIYSLFLCLVSTCCLLMLHEPYELMGTVLTATAIDVRWDQPGEGGFLLVFRRGELLFTLQNPSQVAHNL